MRRCSFTFAAIVTVIAVTAAFPAAGRGQDTVAAGYELLQTVHGTGFSFPCPEDEPQIVALKGVALGSFDFGGGVGTVDVGRTDTILRRRQEAVADAEGSATIEVEIVALSLASREPVELCGSPQQKIYITLNEGLTAALSDRGRRTLYFDPMTFDTARREPGGPDPSLHYWIDVSGAESGFIGSYEKRFIIASEPRWSHQGPPGTLLIDGVNHLLDGAGEDADFFAVDTVVEDDAGNNWHKTRTSADPVRIPALTAWGALLLAALLLGGMTWAMSRRLEV